MNSFTNARTNLVGIYAAGGLDVYAFTPPVVIPPIVTVLPAATWIEPNRIGNKISSKVQLLVTAYVSLIDSAVALEQIEEMIHTLLMTTSTNCIITGIDAPRVDSTSSQGDLLASDITIQLQTGN